MGKPTAEIDARCPACLRAMDSAAHDDCIHPPHRVTDATLGLRETNCGCCVVVDATALDLLRKMVHSPEQREATDG